MLDEVYNTLRQIKSAPTIRPHTMTEELYDLSTMAMEYFKEHLEPQLPTLVNFNRDFIDYHLSKSKSLHIQYQCKCNRLSIVSINRQFENEIPAGHTDLVEWT